MTSVKTISVVFAVAAALTAGAAQAQPAAPTGLTGLWRIHDDTFENLTKLTMPLTPAAQAVRAKDQAKLAAGDVIGESGKKCGPTGMPTMMVNEFALQFLETPDRVTVINEAATIPRTVYLDEKAHPEGQEASYNGHSIGHWEGPTLVIDTVNFNDKTELFGFVGVHSSTTHLVERYTIQPGGREMVGTLTFEDSRFLTKPYTATIQYSRLPKGSEFWEYVCEIGGGWQERFEADPDAKK